MTLNQPAVHEAGDSTIGKMRNKRHHNYQNSIVERSPDKLFADCSHPGLMTTAHWHAQAELNYVVEGWIDYEMRGHGVRLEEGDIALFWGGLPHRVADVASNALYHVYHLPLQQFFRIQLDMNLQRQVMGGSTFVTSGPGPEDAVAFTRWRRHFNAQDDRLRKHAMSELQLRIERMGFEPYRLVGLQPAQSEVSQQGLRSRCVLPSICSYIAENFRDDMDSAVIAASANLNPRQAMNVFRRSTGMSMGAYISLLRVSYAQALLMEDSMSILAVAMDSGFRSLSAFNKCFHEKAGMTPSAFRSRRRQM